MGFPHHGGSNGATPINSPRFAASNMTRHGHSFKRGGGGANGGNGSHEIELQINSPRSESPFGGKSAEGSPAAAAAAAVEQGFRQGQSQLRFRFGVPILGKEMFPKSSAAELVGLRERKKLGNLVFLAFCGVCLLLGWIGFNQRGGEFQAHEPHNLTMSGRT